jgi:hypothetical protein
MEASESTPRLAFLSPEPASGKTRALEVSELLVPNPVEAVNVSPAYLFRNVGDDGAKPTLLQDEVPSVLLRSLVLVGCPIRSSLAPSSSECGAGHRTRR